MCGTVDSLPIEVLNPVKPMVRDFARFKPVSDEVFDAYKLLYAHPHLSPERKGRWRG